VIERKGEIHDKALGKLKHEYTITVNGRRKLQFCVTGLILHFAKISCLHAVGNVDFIVRHN
jgi:hypothetical protein